MNTRHPLPLFLSLLLFFCACTKDNQLDPLGYVVVAKTGVIRVECNTCTINYSVSGTQYEVNVKNSQDIQYSYVSNFELKTTISTEKKQAIRLAVFDAYGRLITNELSSYETGSSKNANFKIKID